jgi:flavodoxin
VTEKVATEGAADIGADVYAIRPAEPYTAEDLNYNDRSTRATVEQNTPDARPEIAEEISLDGVTTLYLGYPIWWGQAPRIMSTFVESHDFTGITVVPFCTSGGSGAGRTGETLGEQAGTGTFLTSTRFSSGVSDSELQSWIDSHK